MHNFQVGQTVCLIKSWEISTPDGPILLPAGLTGEIFSIGKPDYENYGKVVAIHWKYYDREYSVGTWVDLLMDADEYYNWKTGRVQ
jgi:hypothetical protein